MDEYHEHAGAYKVGVDKQTKYLTRDRPCPHREECVLEQWDYGWDGKQANYHHKRVGRVRSHRCNLEAATKGYKSRTDNG